MSSDDGSTIPLVLGFLMISLLLVAGSVAAGDAYVQQSNLQSVCDAAALTASAAADTDTQRSSSGESALRLADVEGAVRRYLDRDSQRAKVAAAVSVGADGATVTVRCVRVQSIAFGTLFALGSGIRHQATSSARSPTSFG
jgi:uncharacterized membrane protein